MNATVTSGTRLFRTPIGKRHERIASRGGREETSRRVRAKAFPSRDCPSHHIPKNSANNANNCILCTPSAPRTSARSSWEGVREDSGRSVRGGKGEVGTGWAVHIISHPVFPSRGAGPGGKRERDSPACFLGRMRVIPRWHIGCLMFGGALGGGCHKGKVAVYYSQEYPCR